MEYLILVAAAFAFVLFVFIQGRISNRKELKYYQQKLREMEGNIPDKEYKIERFVRIPAYYEKHQKEDQIDDITWNDLDMDTIYKRMDYAVSSAGEEFLYYMLRTPQYEEKALKHLDEVAVFYGTHTEDRIRYQLLMHQLGSTGKYSLYDYMEYLTLLGKRSNGKDFVCLGLFVLFLILMCFHLTLGVLSAVIWMICQIITYFKTKREIEAYTTSLAYMMRLIAVADQAKELLPTVCSEEKQGITETVKALKKVKKGAFWIFNSGNSNSTGSPLDAVCDYIRMITHIDLICFNKMLGEIILHRKEIDELVRILGYLEAAICVSLYRSSLKNGYCKPEFTGEGFTMTKGYHPLIEDPVKNSISSKRGVLLTGSNASGKSTFLKMLALNSLTAQTIDTVAAESYCAPFYHLYSSMSLHDSLQKAESYYMAEIKSIKRILDKNREKKGKILCFVDEVLRGTNTVERIAASTQILLHMTGTNMQCFAATHDIELTHLLEKEYDNYHFEEEIVDGDVVFPYQLQKGRATTRNAISLLEVLGYEESIIKNARAQADAFMREGIWKLPG